MNFMKCYHILFTLEGIKNNIGAFILIPIILLQIGSIIFFYIKGYKIYLSNASEHRKGVAIICSTEL